MPPEVSWPDGRRFAFTIFDDTDGETVSNAKPVYDFLESCGFRITKSAWMVRGDVNKGRYVGQTCEDPDYLQWMLDLQAKGFEIGWHGVTWHEMPRKWIESALDLFAKHFGHYPYSAANHSPREGIYWGNARLSGFRKFIFDILTGFRRRNYSGHREGDEYFWGDLCRKNVRYFRNFVYRDINTLKACPQMPYYDPEKPHVNLWFASSDGHDLGTFNQCISEKNQDRLEAEGGACIMYSHFFRNFYVDGKLNRRFQELMIRLSKKNGWFVPVATVLDHLLAINGRHEITAVERRQLETKWLREKIFIGTN